MTPLSLQDLDKNVASDLQRRAMRPELLSASEYFYIGLRLTCKDHRPKWYNEII